MVIQQNYTIPSLFYNYLLNYIKLPLQYGGYIFPNHGKILCLRQPIKNMFLYKISKMAAVSFLSIVDDEGGTTRDTQ